VRNRIATLLAVGAVALVATAAAQAEPASVDQGNSQDPIAYLICTDGTWYAVDTAEFSPDGLAPDLCPDGYTVSDTPPAPDPGPPPPPDGGSQNDAPDPGVDVGIDAPSNQAPDPTVYSTQVQCPDGTIWAVAAGDSFTCP
jgi:hypothetical protein